MTPVGPLRASAGQVVHPCGMTTMQPVPYYSDDLVTLHNARCEDVLPTLEPGSVDVLLTDPPYFQVKDEEWDRQWRKAEEFLAWLGDQLDLCKPLLKPSASVWCFASPEMADEVKRVVGQRWRVLNSIRWAKDAGWHKKAEVEAQRRFQTPWEGIVFAEQQDDLYGDQSKALHAQVFAPIGQYIAAERERAGLTRKELAAWLSGYKNLDSATANVWNWELGKNLISEADYRSACKALGPGFLTRGYPDLCSSYEDLRGEYEALRKQYEELRRPFRLADRGPLTDLWTFPPVMGYPGKHPCEKPVPMLRHMIETSSRPGDLVLDFCAGSGATLRACKETGRRGVGIEVERRYCVRAAERLSQDALIFDEAS